MNPVLASSKMQTPTINHAAIKLQDALSLLDNQIRTVWDAHEQSVEAMSLEESPYWSITKWHSWEKQTTAIWNKNCWDLVRLVKGILENNPKECRAEFFDHLITRSAIIDETGNLGDKLCTILDTLFVPKEARKREVKAGDDQAILTDEEDRAKKPKPEPQPPSVKFATGQIAFIRKIS